MGVADGIDGSGMLIDGSTLEETSERFETAAGDIKDDRSGSCWLWIGSETLDMFWAGVAVRELGSVDGSSSRLTTAVRVGVRGTWTEGVLIDAAESDLACRTVLIGEECMYDTRLFRC